MTVYEVQVEDAETSELIEHSCLFAKRESADKELTHLKDIYKDDIEAGTTHITVRSHFIIED